MKNIIITLGLLMAIFKANGQEYITRPFYAMGSLITTATGTIYDPGGKEFPYPDSCKSFTTIRNANLRGLELQMLDVVPGDSFRVWYWEFGKQVVVFDTSSTPSTSIVSISKYITNNEVFIDFWSFSDGDSAKGFQIKMHSGITKCDDGEVFISQLNNCQGDSITIDIRNSSAVSFTWKGGLKSSIKTIAGVGSGSSIKLPKTHGYEFVFADYSCSGPPYSGTGGSSPYIYFDNRKPRIIASDTLLCQPGYVDIVARLSNHNIRESSMYFGSQFNYQQSNINAPWWDIGGGRWELGYCTGPKDFSLYFGSQSNFNNRYLHTRRFNAKSGNLSFKLKIVDSTAGTYCEAADSGEYVKLKYRLDRKKWKLLKTYGPYGYGDFTKITELIPDDVKTANFIEFKWIQPHHDGKYQDVWLLDSIEVFPENENIVAEWFTKNSIWTNKTTSTSAFIDSTTTLYVAVYDDVSGCRDTLSQTIHVFNTLPNFKASLSPAALDTTFFANLTDSGGASNMRYLWVFGDGDSSRIANPSHVYQDSGTYNVMLIAKNEFGCKKIIEKQVKVANPPKPTFSYSSPCVGNNIAFLNTTPFSDLVDAFYWDFGDGTKDTSFNTSHTYNDTGTYMVKLVSIRAGFYRDSSIHILTMLPKLIANFSLKNGCTDEAIAFTDLSAVETGSLLGFDMDFDGDGNFDTINVPPGNLVYNSYATGGNYLVKMRVRSSAGCEVETTKALKIDNRPITNFSTGTQCLGTLLAIKDESTILNDTIKAVYYDFSGDGKIDDSTSHKGLIKHIFRHDDNLVTMQIAKTKHGCADTVFKLITYKPTPKAQFSATYACYGDTTLLLDETQSLGTLITSVAFDFTNDGTVDTSFNSTGKTAEFVYDSIAIWPTRMVVNASNGCTDTLLKDLEISAKPKPAFRFSETCDGEAVIFYDSTTIASGFVAGVDYDFDNDGNYEVTGLSAFGKTSYTYTTAGTKTLTVQATSLAGCVTKITTSLGLNKAVSIYPTPILGFTYGKACQNRLVLFTDTSSISTGSIAQLMYDFDGNGIFDSIHVSPNDSLKYIYENYGNEQVSIYAISDKGCEALETQSIEILENINPSVSYGVLCEFDTVEFQFNNNSNTAKGEIVDVYYDFDNDHVFDSLAIDPNESVKYLYPSKGIKTLKIKSNTISNCSNTQLIDLEILSKPIVDFSFSGTCLGEATLFSQMVFLDSGKVKSYNWRFGDGSSSTQKNPSTYYTKLGNYQADLAVKSTLGCSASAQKTVGIYPVPKAQFKTTNACTGDTVFFKNNSTISSGTMTYKWDFGDGSIEKTQYNGEHAFTTNGNYTVKLVAVSPQACKDSIQKTSVIYQNPTSSFTADNVCFGNITSFVNSSSNAISYQWDFGDGAKSTAKNPKHLYKAANSYTVSLTTYSANGCKNILSKTIDIYAKPEADFSVKDVCEGSPSIFKNNSKNSQQNLWLFGNGQVSSLQSPSYTYPDSGYFNVNLITTSNKGCKDTQVVKTHIYGAPKANFSATEVCALDSVYFKNASSANSNSFYWNFGDGSTSNKPSPTKVYATGKSYTVQLVVSTKKTCTDTLIKSLNIKELPDVQFSVNNACLHDTVHFTNNTKIGGSQLLSYLWTFGEGKSFKTDANPSFLYSKPGTYTVNLYVQTSESCQASDSLKINILALPKLQFTMTDICQNESITFIDNSPSQRYDQTWDFGDKKTGVGSTTSHVYIKDTTYTIAFRARDANCFNVLDSNIIIRAKPTASFSLSPVCASDVTFFTNTSTKANNYLWSFGTTASSTKENPSYTFTSVGSENITLIATSTYGCGDTISSTIAVNAKPEAKVSATNICFRDSARFYNNSSLNASNIWFFGDDSISVAENPAHYYHNPGTYSYRLIITSSANCKDTLNGAIDVYALPSGTFTLHDVCQSDSAKFTSSLKNVRSVLWNFGDKGTSTRSNPSHLYAKGGNYMVWLYLQSPDGCADSSSLQQTVFELPVVDFAHTNVCLGEKTLFQNYSKGKALTFNWDFGIDSTSTISSPDLIYKSPGVYKVRLLALDNEGCKNSKTTQIEVFPLPEIGFSAREVCLGDTTVLVDTTTILSGSIKKRLWNLDDKNYASKITVKHPYEKSGNYNVQLSATSDKGCEANLTKAVKVFALPQVNFSATTVCQGELTDFEQEVLISKGFIKSYLWDLEDGFSTIDSSFSHQFAAKGLYSAKLVATSNLGCANSFVKEIWVKEKPIALFSVENNCFLQRTVLRNNTSNAQEFRWTMGDGNSKDVILADDSTYLYFNPGNYVVQLVALNKDGCLDTATRSVEIYPLPVANFSIKNGCTINPLEIKEMSDGDIKSWNWTIDQTAKFNGKTPDFLVSDTGQHIVALVVNDKNNCKDSLERLFLVSEPAVPNTSNDTIIHKGSSCLLKTSSGVKYEWGPKEAIEKQNENEVIVRPLNNQKYWVTIEDVNGCLITDSVFVKVLDDYYLIPSTLFTPDGNMQNETWVIKNIEYYENVKVFVFNKTGQKVFESTRYLNDWDGTQNGQSLPDGAYYYLIDCNNGQRAYKGAVSILRKSNK